MLARERKEKENKEIKELELLERQQQGVIKNVESKTSLNLAVMELLPLKQVQTEKTEKDRLQDLHAGTGLSTPSETNNIKQFG